MGVLCGSGCTAVSILKIIRASAFILFALLVGRSVSAADWQIVVSPNSGTQANSLSSVAAAGDNDVWAVGWAYNLSLGASAP